MFIVHPSSFLVKQTMSDFPVTLTDRALEKVRVLLAKDGRPEAFLRVGVKGGGCSGLEYVLKLDTRRLPVDMEQDIGGVKVVCDGKSALYLMGTTLDFGNNLIGGGFEFDNPNADRKCGCGTSFTPKTA